MDTMTKWVLAITNKLPSEDRIQWDKILNPDTDDEMEAYGKVAKYLVEPEGVDDSYFEFQNSDIDKWVDFIKTNIDGRWGELADTISELGY